MGQRDRTHPRWSIQLQEERDAVELVVRFPYDEALKEALKRIPSARWTGGSDRAWRVPARHAAELLELIEEQGHTERFQIDDGVQALAARGGRNARMRRLRRAESTQSFTPLSLNSRLQTLTRETFPDAFWIIGQIQEWRDRGFFSLVERYEDESLPRAVTPAHVWEDAYNHICRQLDAMTPPFRWQNNLDVRLLARIQFQPRYGVLRLQIIDVDPYYTVTLLNERRAEALRRLDEEGISERNIELPLADVPLRLALLTSQGSDAEADFLHILRQSGLGFQIDAYDVRVQGARVEATVLAALDAVARRAADYDAVVITRGGGSGLDLSGFDLYTIGRAVCLHPVPVISGIGHQKNHSLVDDVARPLQTPTEAAHFLVDRVLGFVEALGDVQRRVVDIARARVQACRAALDGLSQHTAREARHHLYIARRDLDDVSLDVQRSAAGRLRREGGRIDALAEALPRRWRRRAGRELRELGYLEGALSPQRRLADLRRRGSSLDALAQRLTRASQGRLQASRDRLALLTVRREAADPARVLERGYALVARPSGALVRDAREVAPGDPLVVRMRAGALRVTRDPEPPDPEEPEHGR